MSLLLYSWLLWSLEALCWIYILFVGQWKFTDHIYAKCSHEMPRTGNLPTTFNSETDAKGLHTSRMQNLGSGPSASPVDVATKRVEFDTHFTFLGSHLNSSGYYTPEILRRISIASSVFGILDNVWEQSCLSLEIKLRIGIQGLHILCAIIAFSQSRHMDHRQGWRQKATRHTPTRRHFNAWRPPYICWIACRHCTRSWLEKKTWKTTKQLVKWRFESDTFNCSRGQDSGRWSRGVESASVHRRLRVLMITVIGCAQRF